MLCAGSSFALPQGPWGIVLLGGRLGTLWGDSVVPHQQGADPSHAHLQHSLPCPAQTAEVMEGHDPTCPRGTSLTGLGCAQPQACARVGLSGSKGLAPGPLCVVGGWGGNRGHLPCNYS